MYLSSPGDYENHECKVQLSSVDLQDAGDWVCTMESYVWGPVRGQIAQKVVQLKVEKKEAKKATNKASRHGNDRFSLIYVTVPFFCTLMFARPLP